MFKELKKLCCKAKEAQAAINRQGRVQQLAYLTYICMPDFGHTYVDTYTKSFPNNFQSFQNFFGSYNVIMLFKNLLLYILPLTYLFVLGRDSFFAFYVSSTETLFFQLFIETISPYLRALVNIGCP